MTTPSSIITPQTIRSATCVLDTASTDLDDSPTTAVLLLTAGSSGARLTKMTSMPRAAFTGRIDLWISKDSGTTKRLIDTIAIAVASISNTAEIATTDWGYSEDNPLMLEGLDRLYMSTAVVLAAGVVTLAQYADY